MSKLPYVLLDRGRGGVPHPVDVRPQEPGTNGQAAPEREHETSKRVERAAAGWFPHGQTAGIVSGAGGGVRWEHSRVLRREGRDAGKCIEFRDGVGVGTASLDLQTMA